MNHHRPDRRPDPRSRPRRRPYRRALGPDDTIPIPDPPSPPSTQGTQPAGPPEGAPGDDERFARALGGCLVLWFALIVAVIAIFWLIFLPGAAIWSLWLA